MRPSTRAGLFTCGCCHVCPPEQVSKIRASTERQLALPTPGLAFAIARMDLRFQRRRVVRPFNTHVKAKACLLPLSKLLLSEPRSFIRQRPPENTSNPVSNPVSSIALFHVENSRRGQSTLQRCSFIRCGLQLLNTFNGTRRRRSFGFWHCGVDVDEQLIEGKEDEA